METKKTFGRRQETFDLMGFLIIIATLMETNWLCKCIIKIEK